MAIQPTSEFVVMLEYLTILGLFLDFIGAVIILGADIPGIAKNSTKFERWWLKRLVRKVENGETIDSNIIGFSSLQTAFGQAFREGETIRPDRSETRNSLGFEYQFKVVRPAESGVVLTNQDGTRHINTNIEKLKSAADNFTASSDIFYRNGGMALVAGFYFQFVAELSKFSILGSEVVFVLAGIIIVYYAIRHT